jgi:hypothetical protein
MTASRTIYNVSGGQLLDNSTSGRLSVCYSTVFARTAQG